MTISFFSEHYINPLTVFGINRIFNTESNKELLIDFLNAIIGLTDKHRICDVQFLKPEQLDTMEIDKKSVFDVYCKTACNKSVIIEMQKDPAIFFWDRKLFYSAFPIRDEILTRKKWNFKLDAVYAIGLLCFCFCDGQEDDGCYLHKVPLNDTEAQAIHDKLTYVFVELPKFKKKENELETQLDKWLYALDNLSEFDKQPAMLSGQIFDKLFQVADTKNFTPEETQAYSFSEKYYLDYVNSIRTAEMEGIQIGKRLASDPHFAEGHDIGYKEGYNHGLRKGIWKGFDEAEKLLRIIFFKSMKEQGFSDETIATILQATQGIANGV